MATNGSTEGTHKHSGFGGRLCAEPYCDEVVKRLLADYENDKSLAFDNYTDSCPELTMRRLQTMEGFDNADELPFGPLPWPTGFPAPGYVPKTNPLNGRWATVSGGDAVTVTTEPKLSTDSEGKVSSMEFYISHLRTSPRSMTPRSMSPLSERRYGSDLDVPQDSRLREITRVVHLLHDQAMPDARVEMAMGIISTGINPDDLSNELDTTQKGFDRVDGADMSFNNEYEWEPRCVLLIACLIIRCALMALLIMVRIAVGDVLPWTYHTAIAGPDADSANFFTSLFAEEIAVLGFDIFFTLIVLLLIFRCFLQIDDCIHDVTHLLCLPINCILEDALIAKTIEFPDDVVFVNGDWNQKLCHLRAENLVGRCVVFVADYAVPNSEVLKVAGTETVKGEVVVDFPAMDADGKNEAALRKVVIEEVLVPVEGAPTTGCVFGRFPQSSGMSRFVRTPQRSLRPSMCPVLMTIGKAAL